ncbi:hypothetical protein HDU96_005548 [Phlyctochytrium bullatum]|nr:hypothetical protein HDU96_005548 [Phlyctochytrium bullatum]
MRSITTLALVATAAVVVAAAPPRFDDPSVPPALDDAFLAANDAAFMPPTLDDVYMDSDVPPYMRDVRPDYTTPDFASGDLGYDFEARAAAFDAAERPPVDAAAYDFDAVAASVDAAEKANRAFKPPSGEPPKSPAVDLNPASLLQNLNTRKMAKEVKWNATYDAEGIKGTVTAKATEMNHCFYISSLAYTEDETGFCTGLPAVHKESKKLPLKECVEGLYKNVVSCITVLSNGQPSYDFEYQFDATPYKPAASGDKPAQKAAVADAPAAQPEKKFTTFERMLGNLAFRFV